MVGHRVYVLIIISFFVTIGCNKLNKNDLADENQLVKYVKYSKYEVVNTSIDTVEFLLDIKQRNGNKVFEYQSGEKNNIYNFNFTNKTGQIIHDNDTVILHFLDRYEIKLLNVDDTEMVYKFVSLEPSIDNANYYFVTPQLGVILKKSTTWPIYSELIQHYQDKENVFNLLLSLIYNNRDFYSNIPAENPPMPPPNE
jgi:hypothetical protein